MKSNRLRQLPDKHPRAQLEDWGRAILSEVAKRQTDANLRLQKISWIVSGMSGGFAGSVLTLIATNVKWGH